MASSVNKRRIAPATAAAVLFIIAALVAACSGAGTPDAPATPAPVATTAPEATAPAADTGAGGSALEGTWEGAIKVAGQEIATRLNFKGNGGTVDFPTQGAVGLPMQNFAAEGASVKFDVLPAPQTASFTGEVNGLSMSGKFLQSGYEGTFNVTRAAPTPVVAKNYQEEEVTFKNGDVTLAGTLTLPNASGPHPAVVLISGSGAQNRDEDLFGFKPFAILADALTNAGVAVLRYDDRGIGGSSQGAAADTSETYAGDVSAAINFLKTRSDIDAQKIGLLGHSEGGIIAPLVSVETGDPAFLILLAGTGVPGRELLVEQAAAIQQADGASAEAVEQTRQKQRAVIDAVLSGENLDAITADLIKEYRAAADKLPAEQKQTLGDLDKWAETTVKAQLAAFQGPWMRFFLTHDPAATLEKVTVPVLALFGEKDTQVPPALNIDPMKAALEKAGNKDVSVTVIPGANHLFQAANTGSPSEYATLPKEFAPGVLDTIVEWVTERVQ
jgi:pimeloyl-ACP methyl ester carboxylesterase